MLVNWSEDETPLDGFYEFGLYLHLFFNVFFVKSIIAFLCEIKKGVGGTPFFFWHYKNQ